MQNQFDFLPGESHSYSQSRGKISDKEYFEFIWTRITCALQALFQPVPREILGMQLYTNIYDLCTRKPTTLDDELYESLRGFVGTEATKCRISILNSDNILEQYAIQWRLFSKAIKTVLELSNYLTRVLEADNEKIDVSFQRLPLKQLFLRVWRENVLVFTKIYSSNCIVHALLANISAERLGEKGDSKNISILIASFLECDCESPDPLTLYREEIENLLAEETCAFYREKVTAIQDKPVSQYLEISCSMLIRENCILSKYFHSSSCEPTMKLVNEILLDAKSTQIIDAFLGFLQANSTHNLYTTFFLFRGIEGSTKPLTRIFESYNIAYGKEKLESFYSAVCSNSSKDNNLHIQITHQLLSIKQHCDNLLKECFFMDFDFESAVEKCMKTLINDRIHLKSGGFICIMEVLLAYLQSLIDQRDFWSKLQQFFTLFKYINDKDHFAKCYAITLANRLVTHDKSKVPDFDIVVVSEMKKICGIDFVLSLQKMLSDYQLSHSSSSGGQIQKGILSASILTKSSWPSCVSFENSSLNESLFRVLSKENRKMLVEFEVDFVKKYQGRKLEWIHCMSTLEVAFGNVEIELPLVHFLISNYLSGKPSFSIKKETLFAAMKFPEEDFSLAWSDLLNFGVVGVRNDQFVGIIIQPESALRTILIPLPQKWLFSEQSSNARIHASNSNHQIAETPNESFLGEEKRQILHSTIVRIMKRQKEIEHSRLLEMVKSELAKSKIHFSPQVSCVKQAIEFLIEKQYIERDPLKHDFYLYIA